MLAYAFLLALVAPALAQTTGHRQCVGGHQAIQQLRIQDCAQTPCDVFQGTNAIMEVDFRALRGAYALTPEVYATALGATVRYDLPPQFQNACDHLQTGSCPLSVNEDATYRFVFLITSIYPPIPVTVQLTLLDQASQSVFCALIDIHVHMR